MELSKNLIDSARALRAQYLCRDCDASAENLVREFSEAHADEITRLTIEHGKEAVAEQLDAELESGAGCFSINCSADN